VTEQAGVARPSTRGDPAGADVPGAMIANERENVMRSFEAIIGQRERQGER